MAKKDQDRDVPDFLPHDIDRPKRGPAVAWLSLLVLAATALVVVLTLSSGVTKVAPGEFAVIFNNVLGTATSQREAGTVIHLPLGLTDVYILDGTQQKILFTAEEGVGDRGGPDHVRIKTLDGSNVLVDVEVQYKLNTDKGLEIVRNIGRSRDSDYEEPGDRVRKLVRAYIRAKIRDAFGQISVEQVSEPAQRTPRSHAALEQLNQIVNPWGIDVLTINVSHPQFNPEYERLIKERKGAEQENRNQEAAQDNAQRERDKFLAGAERDKSIAITTSKGEQQKRLIAAEAEMNQAIERAKGEAYRIRREGEQQKAVAISEAQAIEAEGLNKALGLRQLSEAYATGGLGLVREALALKYRGRAIRGRPYSLSSEVERLRLEQGDGRAASVKVGVKGETP